MPDHSTDPRYCEPGTDLIAGNGAANPVQIGTGVLAATLYSLSGNILLNCQNDRIGSVTIFDTSASAGAVDIFIDLNGAQDDVDIVSFFNTNARTLVAYYNKNAGKTAADAPTALGGADGTWTLYGPSYSNAYTTTATWRRYPHSYLKPTGATEAGIRFLWIRLSSAYVDTEWSSTSIVFLGRLWAGPLSVFGESGDLKEPQFPIKQTTDYKTIQHKTVYGQRWSYKRNWVRTYSGDLTQADRATRISMERLYSIAFGDHLWWPFIPEFKMPTVGDTEAREIMPVRFATNLDISQDMVSWDSGETEMHELNRIAFELEEEPVGLIDLG